jgi:hypothetical protein
MLGFLLKLIITNLFFGSAVFMVFARLNKENRYSLPELFLYALGAGPALVGVLLYYLLMFLPGQSDVLYFAFVTGAFVAMMGVCYKQFPQLRQVFRLILGWLKCGIIPSFGGKGMTRAGLRHFLGSPTPLIIMLIPFACVWIYFVVINPILGTDFLQYGAQSRVFYATKVIEYMPFRYDEVSGFFNIGLHGFSMQLMGTWELMLNNIFGTSYDLFFKSLTGYYCILIVLMTWFWVRKTDKLLSNIAVLCLLGSFGFFILFYNFHIDAFRIFLVSVCFMFTLRLVWKPDRLAIIGLGVFGGLAANVHSLGVMLVCFAMLTLLFFMPVDFVKKRIPNLAAIGVLILIFGGIHYVLDVFWGTGWIFQDIKYF